MHNKVKLKTVSYTCIKYDIVIAVKKRTANLNDI